MVKIYGSSDDLVCLDNSNYGVDEIGCFDVKGVRLFLDDDTIIVVRYIDGISLIHCHCFPTETVAFLEKETTND